VLTPPMVSGWDSNFHFHNRYPQFQPTFFSMPLVGSHILHRPHYFMGCARARLVHCKFRPRYSKEWAILRNRRLLVLDLTRVSNRETHYRVSLHVSLSWIHLRSLFARVLPYPRQHHCVGRIQDSLPPTTPNQS
jgi:hypothetical protein